MRIEQENRRTAERAPQGGGRVRSAAVKEPFAGNGRPTRVPGRAGATAAARSRGRTGGAAVRGRVPAGGAASRGPAAGSAGRRIAATGAGRTVRPPAARRPAQARPALQRPPKAPFVLLIAGLLCGGLVTLLLLNTVLARDSFKLNDLRASINELQELAAAQENQLRERSQPGHLDEAARRLNLREDDSPPMFLTPGPADEPETGREGVLR